MKSMSLLLSLSLFVFLSGCSQGGSPVEGQPGPSGGSEAEAEQRDAEVSSGKGVAVYKPEDMVRVDSKEVFEKVAANIGLLVCAYESDEKFDMVRLERAIPFSEFMEKVPTLPKDQEIIFYCA